MITNIPKPRFLSFWFIERFPYQGRTHLYTSGIIICTCTHVLQYYIICGLKGLIKKVFKNSLTENLNPKKRM